MLIFLKLGGSLITDKRQPEVARNGIIERLASEIAAAKRSNSALKLIIGNGAGSFAHRPAKIYGTRDGAKTSQEWFGFAETADAAARLNRLVVKKLLEAGLPAWSVQPSVALRCNDGVVTSGPAESIGLALRSGLIPVVHGDVALDCVRGATIASTEEIFDWLADHVPSYLPKSEEWEMKRWVLAGEVDGIYTADPFANHDAIQYDLITPSVMSEIETGLGDSHGVDVTGGMMAKVTQSLNVIERFPKLEILVCSGLKQSVLEAALTWSYPMNGEWTGTLLRKK